MAKIREKREVKKARPHARGSSEKLACSGKGGTLETREAVGLDATGILLPLQVARGQRGITKPAGPKGATIMETGRIPMPATPYGRPPAPQ